MLVNRQCKNRLCVRSRVHDLYSFFVQWSPDVYGKEAREQGFVVVEKDELDMIDNFFSDPASCSWEVRKWHTVFLHHILFCRRFSPALVAL